MNRIYDSIIKEHLQLYKQMGFIAGPRQVGKTTLLHNSKHKDNNFTYYNWDHIDDREHILAGYKKIILQSLSIASSSKPVLALDEIHKYKHWKTFVKGLYDTYREQLSILISGSAKLDIYRQGGDSLMGRYFLYRIHPLSLGELTNRVIGDEILCSPNYISDKQKEHLFTFGGFPEPFLSQNMRFYNRWQVLREEQMIFEDIRAMSHIYDLAQLQVLAKLLSYQVGGTIKYSEFAKKVRVTQPTVQTWIEVLCHFYYCFKIRPWTQNVSRSLLKEPKIYLWDWSCISDLGARVENFVASHLLKSVHYWNDTGKGKYELFFLRTKDQQELDFVVAQDDKPWLIVEVKTSKSAALNPYLAKFKDALLATHAFQVAFDMPYADIDIRQLLKPQIVPLVSFLSQLV